MPIRIIFQRNYVRSEHFRLGVSERINNFIASRKLPAFGTGSERP
jgi:hypothetical protein